MNTLLPTFLLTLAIPFVAVADPVELPSGIDHSALDTLLRKYVDDRGFVDYAAWKTNAGDLTALDNYLKQFDRPHDPSIDADENIAGLVNAYNAFTIQWMLQNYPVVSILKTDNPWRAKRHQVGGRLVTLDEIEKDTLIPLIGWKVHSIVVCAARSCPPLRQVAFTAENWQTLMEEAYRDWFAREDLTRYEPEKNRVHLSRIFQWYKKDYRKDPTLQEVLQRYGPPEHAELFAAKRLSIKYLPYNWGINDQSDLGIDFKASPLDFL